MISSRVKSVVNAFLTGTQAAGEYVRGLQALTNSGVISFMEEKAKPAYIDTRETNFEEIVKIEYARAHGYSQALEDLKHFQDLYVHPDIETKKNMPPTDFSGRRIAISRGDLTPEDYTDGNQPEPRDIIKRSDTTEQHK